MYVILSGAMSLDGFIDDASPERLRLSDAADFAAVDRLRAGCDAVLVGAGTIRRDDPGLVLRDRDLAAARVRRGRPADPAKITFASRPLDPGARFFARGESIKYIYCGRAGAAALAAAHRGVATVVADAGERVDPRFVLGDLAARGIERVLVEGGTDITTQFLAADLADEIRLAIAPFLVGDPRAPRWAGPSAFPAGPARPMRLEGCESIGRMAVLRYVRGAS